jgi:signal transduction histidine kinase
MRGGSWRSPEGEGRFVREGGHATRFHSGELEIVFNTEVRLSPALFLHMRLLAQVVGEFYEGKRREAAMRRNAYLQAVHETGARLTHDVKNLLQSLLTLTSLAPREPAEGYDGILQRQLPLLTRRLQGTLEKLRSPEVAERELTTQASDWWTNVEHRLAGGGVTLYGRIERDVQVPSTLFDGFVENAIENARAKREREPQIGISLDFICGADAVKIAVCDTGTAIAPEVAARLFEAPIERGSAMGIGLYHVARHATQAGYRAVLASNEPGRVCFVLERAPAGSAAGQ